MELAASKIIYRKMNLWGWNSIRHLQCSFEDRGFQLKNLQHIYERAKVINFLNNGLNSRDKIAAITSEEVLKTGIPLVEEVKAILHRTSKLSIHDTTVTSSTLPANAQPADISLKKMYVLDVGFSGRKAERRALIIYH
jgi:hypothetical protein